MLILTDKCSITGIQPETVVGICIVERAAEEQQAICVITSCTDGKHSAKSLRYVGYAFDVRTRDMDEHTVGGMIADCHGALNREWDIADEGDHIHFEFQPKVNR